MKRYGLTLLSIAALCIAVLSAAGHAGAGGQHQVGVQEGAPTLVSYQGYVTVNGNAYSGTGYFKFAILATDGQTTWSNDGTLSGIEPAASVALSVTNGLFNVLLGDTSLLGMSQLTYVAFTKPDTSLRVWFSTDALTFQLLSPDRRIAAVPYAMHAEIAKQADMVGGYPSSQLSTVGHKHSGQDVYTGTVGAAFIDPAIARTSQITSTVWANDGPGSGLNADLLDGQNGAAFVSLAGSQTITGAKTFGPASGPPFNVTSSSLVTNLNADQVDGMHAQALRSVVTTASFTQAASLGSSCAAYAVGTGDSSVISLAVPGSGIIVVEANAGVRLSDGVNVGLALSETSGDCGAAGDAHLTRWYTGPPFYDCGFFGCNVTHYSMNLNLTVRRSFTVSGAGAHTFYLNGAADAATTGSNGWQSVDVTAQYYP